MSRHEIGPHARGESLFIADLPDPAGTLHAAVLASPVAHGRILRLDTSPAAGLEGEFRLESGPVPARRALAPALRQLHHRYRGDGSCRADH